MWKVLARIKGNLSQWILVSMVLGLAIGYFTNTGFLNILIIPLTILMVFPMMVNLNIKQLFKKGDFKVLAVSQIINFTIIPLSAFLIGMLFFKDQQFLFIGLMLMAVLPTSGMTISWTGFTKGNINAAVKITVLGLILGALLGPVILNLFFSESLVIPAMKIIKQILFVVLIPMIAGFIIRTLMVKKIGITSYNEKWRKRFPLLSVIGILAVIFIAISLKSKAIIENPLVILQIILPVSIFYLFNFAFTTILGNLICKKGNRTALVYGTVMRNLSIALAIAMSVFKDGSSTIALIIAVSYILQVQFAALYVKYFNRIKEK